MISMLPITARTAPGSAESAVDATELRGHGEGREDFDYEEIDPSYDIGNAYKRGEGGTKKKEPPSRPEKDNSPETINSNDDEIMIL